MVNKYFWGKRKISCSKIFFFFDLFFCFKREHYNAPRKQKLKRKKNPHIPYVVLGEVRRRELRRKPLRRRKVRRRRSEEETTEEVEK